MYVFLSDVFYKVSLAPIFKKLDAFIPALSLLANYIFCLLLFSISQQHQTEDIIWYQPLCVSFYYIIYIVNVCIFECSILQVFVDANFQIAGRLHSCLIVLGSFFFNFYFFVFPQKNKN